MNEDLEELEQFVRRTAQSTGRQLLLLAPVLVLAVVLVLCLTGVVVCRGFKGM